MTKPYRRVRASEAAKMASKAAWRASEEGGRASEAAARASRVGTKTEINSPYGGTISYLPL